MTTILLCAEGKTDVGETNIWCPKGRNFVHSEGWLQPLTRTILGDSPNFEVRQRSSLFSAPGRAKPAPGHGTKSYLAKRAAAVEGFDLVIFMVDADSVDTKRHQDIIGEIAEGFNAYTDNSVGCIACVPLSASEAWLLSDKYAWEKVSGNSVSGLPARPEKIWGHRRDPAGNHPHQFFSRICKSLDLEDCTDTRQLLAEELRLPQIRDACPVSFGAFEANLRSPIYA